MFIKNENVDNFFLSRWRKNCVKPDILFTSLANGKNGHRKALKVLRKSLKQKKSNLLIKVYVINILNEIICFMPEQRKKYRGKFQIFAAAYKFYVTLRFNNIQRKRDENFSSYRSFHSIIIILLDPQRKKKHNDI